jgi:predicted MFS family arabinose efflux permease
LAVLSLGAAVTMLNLGALSPLLPAISRDFDVSEATTGQLATISAAVSFVVSLVATPWMDRWPRSTWFRRQGVILVAGTALSAIAPTFGWLIVARIIASIGSAVIMANCLTGVRELFPDPPRRNRGIGIVVSATTLAFVFGLPIITLLAERLGWRAGFASVGVPVLLLLAGTSILPASQPSAFGSAPRPDLRQTFSAVLGDGRIRALMVVLGLNLGIYTGWLVYFGTYVTTVFAVSAAVLSGLFFFSGITELATNNLTPALVRRFDPVKVIHVLLAAFGLALVATGILVTTIPAVFLVAVIVLNGTAAVYIATNVLLIETESGSPGAVMSVASASIGLGNALGPLIMGWVLAASGDIEVAYRALGLLAFVASAVLWSGTRQLRVSVVART